MPGALSDRSVVITGAGRGIGAGVARLAAREGANVVVNDIDQSAVDETVASIVGSGGSAIGIRADVTDWDSAGALVERCMTEFGAIDGLMNNAGVALMSRGADGVEKSDIDRLVSINILGTMYCGTHALRAMRAQGHGTVLNVTSGAHMGLTDQSFYGATKGAAASLTYAWAADYADQGIRVNAISPLAGTRLAGSVLDYYGVDDSSGEQLAGFGDPDDVAACAVFLLSDAAIGITGQAVRVDHGRLSIVSRPAVRESGTSHPALTVEEVEAAFSAELADDLMPLGLLKVSGGSGVFTPLIRAASPAGTSRT